MRSMQDEMMREMIERRETGREGAEEVRLGLGCLYGDVDRLDVLQRFS
jgi:hypothetical protein